MCRQVCRDTSTCIAEYDYAKTARDFAANVGLPFHTPEEFFLDEEPRTFVRVFEPAQYIKEQAERSATACTFGDTQRLEKCNVRSLTIGTVTFTKPTGPDIVVFCGSPGAGKSSFYWKYLQPLGYGRVNQDILKTVSAERLSARAVQPFHVH